MNKMTDLEWLARNVDLKLINNAEYVSKYEDPHLPSAAYYGSKEFIPSKALTVTQVLAERERLINRPKFEDHPDAKCFVQNIDGEHYKHINTEKVLAISDEWKSGEFGWCYVQKGEVIGDWKDTLMVRPEIEEEVVMKEWKNGLPPVGTVCERKGCGRLDEWREIEVKAYHEDEIAYVYNDEIVVSFILDSTFRPIRTEEEKAVEEIAQIIEVNGHSIKDAAHAIWLSGYKKQPSNN